MAKGAKKTTLKISKGAMGARAKFEEAKHKRDISGKFADKPGTETGKAGGVQAGAGTGTAPKASWEAAAKTSGVLGADKIKLHTATNPKKAGSASAERFSKYKDGMTADEFIAAGGTREDLAWDRKKGFITLHDEPTYAKLSGQAGKSTAEIAEVGTSGRLAAIKQSVEKPPATVAEAAASPGHTAPQPAAAVKPPKPETAPELATKQGAEITGPKTENFEPSDFMENAAGDRMTVGQWRKQFVPAHVTEAQVQQQLKLMTASGKFKITAPSAAEKAEAAAKMAAKEAAIAERQAEAQLKNKLHLEQIKPPDWKNDPRWSKAAGASEDQIDDIAAMTATQKAMGLQFTGKNNKAVKNYSAEDYELVNGTLRDKTYGALTPANKKTVTELDRLTQDTTKEDAILWRGMTNKEFTDMPPPSEFTDMGFSSMSMNPGVALNFKGSSSRGEDVLFRVRVPKGTHAAHIDGYVTTVDKSFTGEAEVITQRGTRFKYISTAKDVMIGGSKHTVIELEVVQNNGAAVTQKIALPTPKPNSHRYKASEIVDLPTDRMADEADTGLKWEYEVEYLKYGGKSWGPGIKDQADFNKRYKAAPITYLTDDQYNNLGYTSVNMNKLPTYDEVYKQIGHRRDPAAIRDRFYNGTTTPPIVLRKDGKLRLMAGQSRIFTGLASGFRVGVKVIDV